MLTLAHRHDRGFSRPVAGRKPGLITRFLAGRRLRRELAAMRDLEDRLLDDIGLTRGLAEEMAESAERLPKWDAPAHWRR